jgi:hypothetical protein
VGVGFASFMASVAGGYILDAHGFAFLFLLYGTIPLIGVIILAVFGRKLLAPTRNRS